MIDEIEKCKTDIITEICKLEDNRNNKDIDLSRNLNNRDFIFKNHYLFQTFIKTHFLANEFTAENQAAQKVFLKVMKNQNFYENLKQIYHEFIESAKFQLMKKQILFIDYDILRNRMMKSILNVRRNRNISMGDINMFESNLLNFKNQTNKEDKRLYFRKKTNQKIIKKKIEKFKQSNLYRKLAEQTVLKQNHNLKPNINHDLKELDSIQNKSINIPDSMLNYVKRRKCIRLNSPTKLNELSEGLHIQLLTPYPAKMEIVQLKETTSLFPKSRCISQINF